jgi:hypothetical protein
MIQNMSNPRSASIDTSLAVEGVDGLDSWAEFFSPGSSGDASIRSKVTGAWPNEQAQDPKGLLRPTPTPFLSCLRPGAAAESRHVIIQRVCNSGASRSFGNRRGIVDGVAALKIKAKG